MGRFEAETCVRGNHQLCETPELHVSNYIINVLFICEINTDGIKFGNFPKNSPIWQIKNLTKVSCIGYANVHACLCV